METSNLNMTENREGKESGRSTGSTAKEESADVQKSGDPFGKRPKLARTPTKTPRPRSESLPGPLAEILNISISDESSSEENPRGEKRKKTDFSSKTADAENEEIKSLNRLKAIIDSLQKLVKVNPNTKVEIKKGIEEAYWCMRTLDMKLKNKKAIAHTVDPIATRIAGTITDKRDVAVQANLQTYSQKDNPLVQTTGRSVSEIRDMIQVADNLEKVEEIMCDRWPIDAFKTVEMKIGNPVLDPEVQDLAIFASRQDIVENKGIYKVIKDRHPEITDIIQKQERLGLACLVNSTKVITEEVDIRSLERYVFVGWGQDPGEDFLSLRDLYGVCKKIREYALKGGRKQIAFAAPGNMEPDAIMKLLECVMHGTDLQIAMYVPRNFRVRENIQGEDAANAQGGVERVNGKVPTTLGDSTIGATPMSYANILNSRSNIERRRKVGQVAPKTVIRGKPRPKGGPTSAVIVAAAGLTYKDLLNKVKKGIDIEKLGVNLKALRSTKNGDLLLEIVGGKKETESLKSEIAQKLSGAGVSARDGARNIRTFHVRGIDATVTEEEVGNAFQSALGCSAEEIKIKSLRPAFGNNQNATVIVPQTLAEKLNDMGRIKIGWVTCRVEERRDLKRCYRCWSFGHQVSACKGPSREGNCLRCGKEGHKAKECKNEPFCPLCNAPGHRADTTRCPVARRTLNLFVAEGDSKKNTSK